MKGTSQSTRKSISNKRAKTRHVTGVRGFHDTMSIYNSISGFDLNIISAPESGTTYGEVSLAGIKALYEKFKIYSPVVKCPQNRRKFYDLGSGVGKVVVGIATLCPEFECYGFEIIPERARLAVQAVGKLHSTSLQRRIHLMGQSFLDPSVVLREASWIFISNLCFDPETQASIAQRLQELEPGAIIICSRQLALSQTQFATLETACVIPMSWSNSSSCWIYRRV
jgi:hypothetical protein